MSAGSLRDLAVEDARARMLAKVTPGAGGDRRARFAAIGRGARRTDRAVRDQPPFDASAMDGYAVAEGDLAWPDFTVMGESAAGRPFQGALSPGETARVFTGAAVPSGCVVVVQERARREGQRVRFEGERPLAGTHVRRRGGDFRAAEALLPKGVRLDAWRLALAASAGRAHARVFAQPRVALVSTGEEIRPAGSYRDH